MKQKTVLIAGLIGLVFGFLFAGTLGIDFFGNKEYSGDNGNLKKDAAAFATAYGLTNSVFEPITGDEVYDMIEAGETFVVYAGRDTCPYCQQYVPVLQDAAENLDLDVVYHVDTLDTLNKDFVDDENVNVTPTTYIYKDGVLVATIVGYKNLTDTQTTLDNSLN
jgi:predicted bacteriocin transport accessory protein